MTTSNLIVSNLVFFFTDKTKVLDKLKKMETTNNLLNTNEGMSIIFFYIMNESFEELTQTSNSK